MAFVKSNFIPLRGAQALRRRPSYRQGGLESLWFAWERSKARFSRARVVAVALACLFGAIGIGFGAYFASQAGSGSHGHAVQISL